MHAQRRIAIIYLQNSSTITAGTSRYGAFEPLVIQPGQLFAQHDITISRLKVGTYTVKVTIDPQNVIIESNEQNNEYTFFNVRENHTIHITFTKKKFTITVIYNQGGSVQPGTSVVEYGDNKTFEIKPQVSHNIQQVKVDGGETGPADVS